jgi:hypothetical protein
MMVIDHGNHVFAHLATDRSVSERISASEIFFGGRSHPAAEYRTRHLLVDVVERIHRAFDPCLIDLRSHIISIMLPRSE